MSSTAQPRSRACAQRAPDECGGADIEAARRLRGDDQPRRSIELAGEDQLLRIAARQRPGLLQRRARIAHPRS